MQLKATIKMFGEDIGQSTSWYSFSWQIGHALHRGIELVSNMADKPI